METRIKIFRWIIKKIEFVFKDSNITKWDDIFEFSQVGNIYNEKINRIAKYGKKHNAISLENDVFDFVLENSTNQSYYKSIKLGYIIGNNLKDFDLLNKIKESYTPDEFLFTKTLMEKIYFSNINKIFSTMNKSESADISLFTDNLKSNRIKNIINPIRHFVLMFQSVDYTNDVLMNQFGFNQILFGYLNNIKVKSSNDEKLSFENLRVKRDIPVEIFYVIYSTIFIILLYISSRIFIKKIHKS